MSRAISSPEGINVNCPILDATKYPSTFSSTNTPSYLLRHSMKSTSNQGTQTLFDSIKPKQSRTIRYWFLRKQIKKMISESVFNLREDKRPYAEVLINGTPYIRFNSWLS